MTESRGILQRDPGPSVSITSFTFMTSLENKNWILGMYPGNILSYYYF